MPTTEPSKKNEFGLWKTWVSSQQKQQRKTAPLKIVQLRHHRAKLLGYPSHAAFVLEERMAKDETTVRQFLTDLQEKALPKAKRRMGRNRCLWRP